MNMSAQASTSTQEQREQRHVAAHAPMSWKNSYWVIALLALSIGILSIAGSITLDWVIHGIVRPVFASDILEAAVAAAVSGAILVRMQARRRDLLVRMQIVEDVNHHVRNALTAITLSSSLRQDPELNAQVRDACDRIDWVLNDALSQTAGRRGSVAMQPEWRSGRRLLKKIERKR
jgi:hypothetical protein